MTRYEWCHVLAKLTSPSFANEATQTLIDMLPAFRHFPDELFTAETAIAVAGVKRRQAIPAFDEIRGALNQCRRPHSHDLVLNTSQPALPEPERRSPTEAEIAAVCATVNAWKSENAARKVAEAEGRAKPIILRDVTLKGDQLEQMRAARTAAR